MANISIYHPGTNATAMVPEESVWHYRQGGWLTSSEWAEHEALRAAREAEAAEAEKPAVKTQAATGRPVSGEAKKE